MQKTVKLAATLLVLRMLCFAALGHASLTQYDVQAAFLLNFARFVEWPKGALSEASEQLNICIIGQDPYGEKLMRIFANQTIKGKKPELKHVSENAISKDCQIVYVGVADRASVSAIINKLKGTPILTVSDASGFAEEGGIIQFKLKNNRVGFRINLKVAKQAGLEISSKLLNLAEVLQ